MCFVKRRLLYIKNVDGSNLEILLFLFLIEKCILLISAKFNFQDSKEIIAIPLAPFRTNVLIYKLPFVVRMTQNLI